MTMMPETPEIRYERRERLIRVLVKHLADQGFDIQDEMAEGGMHPELLVELAQILGEEPALVEMGYVRIRVFNGWSGGVTEGWCTREQADNIASTWQEHPDHKVTVEILRG